MSTRIRSRFLRISDQPDSTERTAAESAESVVGGAVTYYLAVTRPDALVSQDCVQDGVTMKCGETDQHQAP